MAEQKRDLKIQVSRSLPEAIEQTILDAADAGVDFEDVNIARILVWESLMGR